MSMYLPQVAQKSSTAAFAVPGGMVTRSATDAIETAIKMIGILSYVFEENKKGLDSSVFTFRENH